MSGHDHLRTACQEFTNVRQQHEASVERQSRLGLIEHPQATDPGSSGEKLDEGLAVALEVVPPRDAHVIEIGKVAVHRLCSQEYSLAGASCAAHELQVVGKS